MGNTRVKGSAIILHIPHSSTLIPEEYRHQFVLGDEELGSEQLKVTDHFTDELFTGLLSSSNKVVANVSRLLVDVERFANDDQESMARKGVGCIYQSTSSGMVLRNELTEKVRQELLEKYYYPHHDLLTYKVNEVLKDIGKCMIIDCHSFPSIPLSYDENQTTPRPDICIGTDPFHTPIDLVVAIKSFFESHQLSVAVNSPYSGTMVPLVHYQSNPNVHSLMIEVNRSLYINESTSAKNENFNFVQQILHTCFESIPK